MRSIVVVLVLTSSALGQDMALEQVMVPGEAWKGVGKFPVALNALAVAPKGDVYVAGKNAIYKVVAGEATDAYKSDFDVALLASGPDGTIYDVSGGVRFQKLGRLGVNEKSPAEWAGRPFGLAISPSGKAYYAAQGRTACHIVLHGDKRSFAIADEPNNWFGPMAVSPDGGTLAVAVPGAKAIYALRIDKDGGLSAPGKYYAPRVALGEKMAKVGGLAFDAAGRLYAGMPTGVQVFDPTGRLCGEMTSPDGAIGAVGLGEGRLYALAGGRLYERKVKAAVAMPKKAP